jgi:uncharacterized protein with HEPN domain
MIGEAASRVSSALQEQHPHVPWADIVSMRNVIVHHYFGVDLDQVWDAVENDVPKLKNWITSILSGIADS